MHQLEPASAGMPLLVLIWAVDVIPRQMCSVQDTMGLCTPSGLPLEGRAMRLALRTGPSASGRLTSPPRRMAMQQMGCSSSLPRSLQLGQALQLLGDISARKMCQSSVRP